LSSEVVEIDPVVETRIVAFGSYLKENGITPVEVRKTPLYTRFVLKERDESLPVAFRGISDESPEGVFNQTSYGSRYRNEKGEIVTDSTLLDLSKKLAEEPTPRNLIQWYKTYKGLELNTDNMEHTLEEIVTSSEKYLKETLPHMVHNGVPIIESMMSFDQGQRNGGNSDTSYAPYVSVTPRLSKAMGYSMSPGAQLVVAINTSSDRFNNAFGELRVRGSIDKEDISEVIFFHQYRRTDEEQVKVTTELTPKRPYDHSKELEAPKYERKDFEEMYEYFRKEYSSLIAKKLSTRYPKLMTDPTFKLETLSGDPYTDMVYSIYRHYRERDGRALTNEDIEEYKVAIPRRKYRETMSYVSNLPGMEEYK